MYGGQRSSSRFFTPLRLSTYTASVAIVKATRTFFSALCIAAAICLFGTSAASLRPAQETSQKPAEKTPEKTSDKVAVKPAQKLPAEIVLLETHIRFETDGSSRKEVHALVKINDELGVRQFARLNFGFNRAFEQIEIPLVRITHPSGGIADVLPSAITDSPNPAVVNAPAYQDVRVKSVRILGLEPGDSLEYRVITTVSHHPLAPDFWLDHTFDRTGVVSHEIFELDLPASRFEQSTPKAPPPSPSDGLGNTAGLNEPVQNASIMPQRSSEPGRVYVSPKTPETSKDKVSQAGTTRLVYKWNLDTKQLEKSGADTSSGETNEPDIAVSTFATWSDLAIALGGAKLYSWNTRDYWDTLQKITGGQPSNSDLEQSIYEGVSKKIRTVDLPFEGYALKERSLEEVVSSGYGTASDKAFLFFMLSSRHNIHQQHILFTSASTPEKQIPRPSLFSHLLMEADDGENKIIVDPSMEVAPYGLIAAHFHGGKGLRVEKCARNEAECWMTITQDPPFKSNQRVSLNASISADGTLTAKTNYSMRGDNELLLRVAFHQTLKEKWNEVAQLLALSDGFRGKVSKVIASDPYETHNPFTVEYEITQPKFVDWSKKLLRIPAILPLLGLPDPPAKPAAGAAAAPIDLGTPLDVEVTATLHLPAGTTAHIPTGTSIERDFATYTSQYSAKDGTLTATRHLNFILKEIPANRAADYNALLRTVQNDESQTFLLERADTTPAPAKNP